MNGEFPLDNNIPEKNCDMNTEHDIAHAHLVHIDGIIKYVFRAGPSHNAPCVVPYVAGNHLKYLMMVMLFFFLPYVATATTEEEETTKGPNSFEVIVIMVITILLSTVFMFKR